MGKLNVLLLGGGGREHALAWKIAQSPLLGHLFIAPGNPGTAGVGTNLPVSETDFAAIGRAIVEHEIDLLVVGPEAPLVKGIRGYVENDPALRHVKVVGPGAEGARMEGSKAFSKAFMERHGIPTAKYGRFTAETLEDAKKFLSQLTPPYVLKADGLAAGKGVLILDDKNEAAAELEAMLHGGKFGEAGATVVIEEFLRGIELSVFILTDGIRYLVLPEAKDYKRIGEGDQGLNTGGMGSISPVPFADQAFMSKVRERVIEPTVNGWKKDGMEYVGFLFIGLMNMAGDPYVIEYNCRMGDPETESVIPRIKSDLLDALWKCANRALDEASVEVDTRTAACIMAVSGGYPEDYEKGKKIEGLPLAGDSLVFHAGTKVENGNLVTSGGRVMAVTTLAEDLETALSGSYKSLAAIKFGGMYYRRDIGFDLK